MTVSQKTILVSKNTKKNSRVETRIHSNVKVPYTVLSHLETLESFFLVHPEMEFACTNCDSLKIFLKTESVYLFRCRCLDCKTEWIETIINNY